MRSRQALADSASQTYYGYGLVVGKNKLGEFIRHSGGWPGYTTNLAHYFDGDRTIIILSNNESSSPALSETIAHLLNNEPLVQGYEHKPATVDSTAFKAFVGTYSYSGITVKLVMEKGLPVLVLNSNNRRALVAESPTKLYYADGRDFQLEIVTENGQNKYYRIAYGIKEEMKKLN
jgi:hypothetical protein